MSELTASAVIEAMLEDVAKTASDYHSKGDKSGTAKDRLVSCALEWVYDQGCATALAEFELAASAYTGNPVSGDED